MFVVTADQVRSLRTGDRVPEALDALARAGSETGGVVRRFERTVGDEIQGLLGTGAAVVAVVEALTRLGDWRIGIGIGPVETPIPRSTRAASGPAFLRAREAVVVARGANAQLSVRADDRRAPSAGGRAGPVGGAAYGGPDVVDRAGELAEGVLWLLVATLRRRTEEGWEVVDVIGSEGSGKATAERLGISPSAVSQRLSRAAWSEVRRGSEAAAALLDAADGGDRTDLGARGDAAGSGDDTGPGLAGPGDDTGRGTAAQERR